MKLSDFDYELPGELIAQRPAEPRDSSRLLRLSKNSGEVGHHVFNELPKLLPVGSMLVVNNSKVIRARLKGQRASGGGVEVFLLKELAENKWECLCRGLGKLQIGEEIYFPNSAMVARLIAKRQDGAAEFEFSGDILVELEKIGQVPLPPYITDQAKAEQYQTVYAREDGSVAAPTAGLHFTPEVFRQLKEKGIEVVEVTLHVGYGTFAPVKTEDIIQHQMHSEWYALSPEVADTINAHKVAGGKVIAVGTTSTRVLESCADKNGRLVAGSGETDIFIYPGYRWRCIDGLLTNFHLPKSTLLMLVSALAGTDSIRSAYREAVEVKYRFYSFGDCMLIT